jgi:hypothetical protein
MADLGYGTSNNGAGTSESARINTSHRDKIGKYGNLSVNYGFNTNNSAFASEQAVETINPLGTFYSNSQSSGANKRNSHTLNSNFDFNNKFT